MNNLRDIIVEEKARIIDVRTPMEFAGGSVAGAENIPLNELPERFDELSHSEVPIVLCCASGNRSGQAEMYLRSRGMDNVFNGGSWFDVNYMVNI